MGKLQRYRLAVLVFILFAAVCYPVGADGCDALVLDEAGVFGAHIKEVEAVANELVLLGADVRVRTVKTFGAAGNLDIYVANVEKQCRSWQAADGGRKNNLIVVMIAVNERKTGIYYGYEWKRSLDSAWEGVITDKMNTRFRDGDFVTGFVNGLGEIHRLIDLQVHPPIQPVPPVQVVVEQKQPSPPLDLSGLWRVLGWVVGLIALGAVAVVIFVSIRTYQASREIRRAAQQKAKVAKQRASRLIAGWQERIRDLEMALAVLEGQVAEDELGQIRSQLQQAQHLHDAAAEEYAKLDTTAGDPDRPGLTAAEYETIEKTAGRVLGQAQQADRSLAEIIRAAESLRQMVVEVPKAVETAKQQVEQAGARIAQVAQEGFRVNEASETLGKAADRTKKAEEALQQRRFQAAKKAVEEARQLAGKAVSQAEALSETRRAVEQTIAALKQRIEQVKAQIIAGAQIFDQIAEVYAESCWESIRGNGTEAENRVNWAQQNLEAASDLASMEKQEWSKAQGAIKEANAWLDETESFMRSISALKQNLEAAKRDAPGEIAAAQKDITQAEAYIARYDDDIRESLEADLAQAQKVLDIAKAELAKTRPDYLKVIKLAQKANASADQILAEARNEHEAAERLRQRATQALRDAAASISKTAEYIEDHQLDVGRTAKSSLDDAQKDLQRAKSASDPSDQVDLAEKAEKAADSAYSRARKDVDAAEEARRPKVVAVTPSPTPSPYSGWGTPSPLPRSHRPSPHRTDDDSSATISRPSGGGSSSWGSRPSGGGGSSSWGSRSGGGGGSKGW